MDETTIGSGLPRRPDGWQGRNRRDCPGIVKGETFSGLYNTGPASKINAGKPEN
jgi:hypothetical protein